MHITPISSFRNYYIPKQKPISFSAYYDGTSPNGKYNYGDGERYSHGRIHNYSCLMREPGLFLDMSKMLEDKFPNGVKIYDYGCSVGYEPVSISLGLHNSLSEKQIKKYLPIYARDNNAGIIKEANKFRLRFGEEEHKRLNLFENINKDDFFVAHRKGSDGQKIYECKDILKNEIIFEYADLFEDLDNDKLSDEPCVLLIKNAWQFMTPEGKTELAEKLHEKLQPGSIVIIGGMDISSGADKNLLNAGFNRVNKVYSFDAEADRQRKLCKNADWLTDYIYDKSLDIKRFCFEH